ncbi:MAG: hypothetical protein ACYTXE_17540 [Nostoc sp.]|uniref:hypothetical protein n=1 Tax=Nostoc sp. TaxID=1180 RepID=UPI002FFA37E9
MLSKITKNLADPLKVLFYELCQEENTESLTEKTAILQQFQHTLEHLDNELENKIHKNIASSIFTGFSVCLAISGASLLTSPLVIAVVLAASVGSAATIIGGTYKRP